MSLPKLVKLTIVAATTLGAIGVLAWVGITIALPPGRVQQMVQQELSRIFAREVSFESASVSLFPPVRLTVRNLALAEPEGMEAGKSVEVRAVHLDLDLLALLSQRVVVRRLVLRDPRVHLVIREDGTNNFDGLMRPEPAKGGAEAAPAGGQLGLAIKELVIENGGVLIDDFRDLKRTLLTVNSKLSLNADASTQKIATSGRTAIKDLAFGPINARSRAQLQTGLSNIEWRIEHRGTYDVGHKRLALDPLSLRFGSAELALTGLMENPGPRARVHLRTKGSNVDLSEVFTILSAADASALQGISGDGDIDFELEIRGTLGLKEPPVIIGYLKLSEGRFRYPGALARVEAVQFRARFAPDTLEIPAITALVVGKGNQKTPVQARLLITQLADPMVRFAMKGDFDLAAVAPMLADQDAEIAGRAVVDVQGRGLVNQPGAIAVSGRVALRDVSVNSPRMPKPIHDINGNIQFSRSHAEVINLHGTAGDSDFRLDARVERPLALLLDPDAPAAGPIESAFVDFDLTSSYMDLAELSPAPSAETSRRINARGKGRVRIKHLKRDRLDIEAVNADIEFTPTTVRIPNYSFTGYQGNMTGSATIDLSDRQSPRIEIRTKLNQVDANAILSAWTPAKGLLSGTLSTDLDLVAKGLTTKEILPTLTAAGLASLSQGTLGPGPVLDAIARFTGVTDFGQLKFNEGSVPFQVQNGRLAMRQVTLDGPSGDWKLAGSIGFDGTLDYIVSATIPPHLVSQLGAGGAVAAGALQDSEGRVFIDLRVTGPAKSPRIAWDKGAMADRLRGRISQALQDQQAALTQQALNSITAIAAGDSATSLSDVQADAQAFVDSLKKVSAGDFLKGFFGGSKDDDK